MEEKERSRSPSRRTSRVEQVVGRWLRRSRESVSRERVLGDGKFGGSSLHNAPIRLTVKIPRDVELDSHGFSVSTQSPLLVKEVTAGGPAEGRLVPGDHLLKINNVLIDDLSTEQAAEIIRESCDSVTLTVLRHTLGPKSAFLTAEKRARLKTNPVKVRFSEEVVVNGHMQGDALLFLPNVLKVYLENGQTKAFKFEKKTTVKDIVLTLKEKLSIHAIEHFALVLEEQYSIAPLLLLHEDEFIQQVAQRSRDYRCLFRVCFLPRDPLDLLQEDPVAFEYLYLQSVSDVLLERFAVEMKCNTALHLAALHIQERLHSCGQTHRTSLKSVTKDWGIESFISPTLLRNMSEKDLRKAINYHMKKIQALLEPKQKVISATQARLSYLTQLGELQSYGGKSFTATLLLQDRDSMVNLLVGARYGISQVINHKLKIIAPLTEFSSISRLDLLPETERVSLVKVYLQDVRQMTLLMESAAAKDLTCLVTGYCRLFMDPALSAFSSSSHHKVHRISAGEGHESRRRSDPEDTDVLCSSATALVDLHFSRNDSRAAPASQRERQLEGKEDEEGEKAAPADKVTAAASGERVEEAEEGESNSDKRSESPDRSHTDSLSDLPDGNHAAPSPIVSLNPEVNLPYILDTSAQQDVKGEETAPCPNSVDHAAQPLLCFAELSLMPDCLPSPPEATDEEEELRGLARRGDRALALEGRLPEPQPGAAPEGEPTQVQDSPPAPLQPSPSFVDSSSEEEFFDAQDRFIPSAFREKATESCLEGGGMTRTLNLCHLSEVEREQNQDERRDGTREGEGTPCLTSPRRRRPSAKTTCASQEREETGPPDSGLPRLAASPAEGKSAHLGPSPVISSGSPPLVSPDSLTDEHLSPDVTATEPETKELRSESPPAASPPVLLSHHVVLSEAQVDTQGQTMEGVGEVMVEEPEATLNYNAGELQLPEQPSPPGFTGRGEDGEGRVTLSHAAIPSVPLPPSDPCSLLIPNSLELRAETEETQRETDSCSLTLDYWKRNGRSLAMLVRKDLSLSCESLLPVRAEAHCSSSRAVKEVSAATKEPLSYSLGLVGCLSNSVLRAKIQRLPQYLSRSQDTLSCLGSSSTDTVDNSPRATDKIQVTTDATMVPEENAGDTLEAIEFADEVTDVDTEGLDEATVLQGEVKGVSSNSEVHANTKSDALSPLSKSYIQTGNSELSLGSPGSAVQSGENARSAQVESGSPGVTDRTQAPNEVCGALKLCESKQPQSWPHPFPQGKAQGCPTVMKVHQAPRETCGCRTTYSNCFSGEQDRGTFDEELTVHEFHCRTQKASLTTTPPSLLPSSPILAFSRGLLPRSSSAELSPSLSPMECSPADSPESTLSQLRDRQYVLPGGFALLQRDIGLLQAVLHDKPRGQDQHHWETCVAHFSQNQHLLHAQARRLMSDCQRVIRVGQTPEEMLRALAGSFHALVKLADTCLWFSTCGQCEGSLGEVLASLEEIAKAYGDFSQAAERACGRKSCHDLSIKLLAGQCTSLTASVFCLTQLYGTLAAL